MSYDEHARSMLPLADAGLDKYEYAKQYKDAGNTLFKEKQFDWAIKTYTEAVQAIQKYGFDGENDVIHDPEAATICCQCLSNAALCSLKLEKWDGALSCCEASLKYFPKPADKAKVLNRRGQAYVGLRDFNKAVSAFEQALAEDPQSSIKKELARARKALELQEKKSLKKAFKGKSFGALFGDDNKEATKKAAVKVEESAMDLALSGKAEESLEEAKKVLAAARKNKDRQSEASMLFCSGFASYILQNFPQAADFLRDYFALEAELRKDGGDALQAPLLGLVVAHHCLALSLYRISEPDDAKLHFKVYLEKAEAAGELQAIHNLPDGWQGRKISEQERQISRYRYHAHSKNAKYDAYTILAVVTQGNDEEEALGYCGSALKMATTMDEQIQARNNLASMCAKLGKTEESQEHAKEVRKLQVEKAQEEEKEKAKEKTAGHQLGDGDGKGNPDVFPNPNATVAADQSSSDVSPVQVCENIMKLVKGGELPELECYGQELEAEVKAAVEECNGSGGEAVALLKKKKKRGGPGDGGSD
jgi:tetratricopeptide (TPR) repeat protein